MLQGFVVLMALAIAVHFALGQSGDGAFGRAVQEAAAEQANRGASHNQQASAVTAPIPGEALTSLQANGNSLGQRPSAAEDQRFAEIRSEQLGRLEQLGIVVGPTGNQFDRVTQELLCRASDDPNYCIYTVEEGDTLGHIAQRFGLNGGLQPGWELIAASNQPAILDSDDYIQPGQMLWIPRDRGVVRTIVLGESVSELAVMFDVTSEAIIKANNLPDRDFIRTGEVLFIPDPRELPSAAALYAAAEEIADRDASSSLRDVTSASENEDLQLSDEEQREETPAEESAREEPTPERTREERVRPQPTETPQPVQQNAAASEEPTPEPTTEPTPEPTSEPASTATPEPARERQPRPTVEPREEPEPTATPEPARVPDPTATPEPPAPPAQPEPAPQQVQAQPEPPAPPAPQPAAQPVSSAGFIWPISVERRITNYFGPAHPLGIDLGLFHAPNTNILAVADGVVEFAGGQVCCSYGLYVIVDHGNGLKTLYAHLSRIDVRQGQRVTQGQSLGPAGTTGYSTGVHLHFEVHRDGTRVDPLRYLP